MTKWKQRLVVVAFILAGLYVLDRAPSSDDDAALADAFSGQRHGVQVEGEGTVARILEDDNDGSRHQRFVVRLASGQTLLMTHNIDLAPRVEGLSVGDVVGFYGEYEWNDQGGAIHWTHHDPEGRHVAGWIRYKGRVIQ